MRAGRNDAGIGNVAGDHARATQPCARTDGGVGCDGASQHQRTSIDDGRTRIAARAGQGEMASAGLGDAGDRTGATVNDCASDVEFRGSVDFDGARSERVAGRRHGHIAAGEGANDVGARNGVAETAAGNAGEGQCLRRAIKVEGNGTKS